MDHNDSELVKKALNGESDAFESLVKKYQDAVYGLAFHLVGDFDDAQDIAQETFVSAYLRLSQLKEQEKFAQWLNKITVHENASWMRRKYSISRLRERMDSASASVPSPEEEYEKKELKLFIKSAMSSLSEKNRLAVSLYYIDGLTQAEVGDFLGVSQDVVSKRISRARKQLKDRMMKMLEGTFRENRLPDDFTKRVKKSLTRAQSASKRGKLNESLNYFDEALSDIGKLPESPETRKLLKDTLWQKGDALEAGGEVEDSLKYHEQVVKLAEEEGDRRVYAEYLLGLSHDYSHRTHEEMERCLQKALEIYEELGDIGGQAEVWLWKGSNAILSRPESSLLHFQKALDMYSRIKGEHPGYESMCRAIIRALKEVGDSKLIFCQATSEILKKTSGKLARIHQPGFGRGGCREGDKMEGSFVDNSKHSMVIPSIVEGGTILNYGLRVGDKEVIGAISWTSRPQIAERIVESDSDSVEIAAGDFANCLKLKTVIRPDPDEEGYDRQKEINRRFCGTKQVWFAPGVGPVRYIFDRIDGERFELELAEYAVGDDRKDYFPLSVGNRWVYRWLYYWPLNERYIFRDRYEVGEKRRNVYYIDHCGYAYFSGGMEEYEAIQG